MFLEGASNLRMLSSADRLLGVREPLVPLAAALGARVAPEDIAEGISGGESAPCRRPIMLAVLRK